MTPRLNYTNIAIVGLLQVGVIVSATLGAGSVYKMSTTFGFRIPAATQFAADYGFVVLLVPMLWITVAMALQSRDEHGDAPEAMTFVSGVGVLLLLLVGAFVAAVIPLFRILSPGCSLSLST
jgi:hypothetical protein